MSGVATRTLWQLRLLGAFELGDGAQRITRVASRPAAALLARLALRPDHAHPREELVELLWPGAEPEAARHRLRQTLSTLKALLEPPQLDGWPVLQADRHSIKLVAGSIACDAAEFELAVKGRDIGRAHQLYRGDFMPGWFDEWIVEERARLQALFDRVSDAPVLAVPVPTPMARPASPSPSHAPLPSYLTRMVGADPQAARLRREILKHRLVTLRGPGGAGKTRLAVEVAQSLAASTPEAAPAFDLVLFVPLATCASAEQVLDQIHLALRLPSGRLTPLEQLVSVLTARQVLLVLDNFEQVAADGAALVDTLGQRLPQLHLLVTSRRVLDVPGEQDFLIDTLAPPPTELPLAEAALNPAVALFVDRARAARADFHLHDGNHADVQALMQRLGGLPLAIELAAARVRSLPPGQMLQMLEGSARTLDLLARPRAEGRHSSMQATIAWSWGLLPEPAQAAASALTVFGGSFSLAAAVWVCEGVVSGVALALDELTAQSMLRAQTRPDGSARFLMLEPVREFALAQLAPELARRLRLRHRVWWAERGRSLPVTVPLGAMREDMPDLVAALQSAHDDGAVDELLRMVLSLRRAFEGLNLPARGLALLESAVARCEDPALQGRGRTLLGPLLYTVGRGAEGTQSAQAGLAAARGGDPGSEAEALLACVSIELTTHPTSIDIDPFLEQARELAQRAQRADLVARAELLTGLVALGRDRDLPRAEALHRAALERMQGLGDGHAVARLHYGLAHIAMNGRRFDEALAQAEAATRGARELEHWLRASQAANMKGAILAEMRLWKDAAVAYCEAVLLAWEQAAPLEMAFPLWNLPRALAHLGQPALAVQLISWVAVTWAARFGPLNASHHWDVRRIRRLAALQMGAADLQAAEGAGQALNPAGVIALLRRI